MKSSLYHSLSKAEEGEGGNKNRELTEAATERKNHATHSATASCVKANKTRALHSEKEARKRASREEVM